MARSGKRITQNAVLALTAVVGAFAIGTVVVPHDGATVTVEGKEKKTIDLKTLGGELIETVQPGETSKVAARVTIADVDGATSFLTGHNALPAKPRSGYDMYYNDDGPVNPQSPNDLTVQGLLRNGLVFIQALHAKASEGGETGEAATAALDCLREYDTIAADKLAESQQATAETDLLAKAAALNIDINALKALMGTKAPTATVPASEATDTVDELEEVPEGAAATA